MGERTGFAADGYRSCIPPDARERVTATYPDGRKKEAEYELDGEVAGVRWFRQDGGPDYEYALKDGRKHGMEYEWHASGRLLSAEPYLDGRTHGTFRQWASDGTLIGTYTMDHGTGLDLWRQEREDGSVYLAEARYLKDGDRHGFEWWIDEDQRGVHEESHFRHGLPHGIERQWNSRGRLRRGFPRYYVRGERVTKARYVKACANDPSLPPFREEENAPGRTFPPEVAKHLGLRV